ncbi:hypothetical protein QQF64_026417 [Cirrhinus molitorella]|uniref:C1q domain-containing protein n=1 Tax=Cirrhinus molitorella TaxID=172907 RepID=A0ABR3N9I5_9TELE
MNKVTIDANTCQTHMTEGRMSDETEDKRRDRGRQSHVQLFRDAGFTPTIPWGRVWHVAMAGGFGSSHEDTEVMMLVRIWLSNTGHRGEPAEQPTHLIIQKEATMKLQISIIFLLCIWTTLAEDSMNPKTDNLFESQILQLVQEELNALKDEVRNVISKNEEREKVAFSASLPGLLGPMFFGPYAEATTLVYGNIFTNVGNAYDSNTGIFTAPVKGVYFFNFVVFNAGEKSAAVTLLKNGQLVLAASDNSPGQDTEDTSSNSVSLILEQGDKIHLQLVKGSRVYTDSWMRNTFNGHLLFTL